MTKSKAMCDQGQLGMGSSLSQPAGGELEVMF